MEILIRICFDTCLVDGVIVRRAAGPFFNLLAALGTSCYTISTCRVISFSHFSEVNIIAFRGSQAEKLERRGEKATPAQQCSPRRMGFPNLSISRNRTHKTLTRTFTEIRSETQTRTFALICSETHTHTHIFTQIHSETHTHIHAHIYSQLDKVVNSGTQCYTMAHSQLFFDYSCYLDEIYIISAYFNALSIHYYRSKTGGFRGNIWPPN